ncbi:MAG: hypothetical protein Q8P01_02410 [bacterium]|nr:hypothetical protein [bacterium]
MPPPYVLCGRDLKGTRALAGREKRSVSEGPWSRRSADIYVGAGERKSRRPRKKKNGSA